MEVSETQQKVVPGKRNWKRWSLLALYALVLLSSQPAANLLSEFYFKNGGKSVWISSIATVGGFPLLLVPFTFSLLLSKPKEPSYKSIMTKIFPSSIYHVLVYVSLGLLFGGNTVMYSYGLFYLPVSTYSIISSSQLAFSALFSYFLNAQKLTPCIVNSMVLLTLSAILLAFGDASGDTDSTGEKIPKGEYALGLILTTVASASYSLLLCLISLSFEKIIKNVSLAAVLKMLIYTSFTASCFCVTGLFASGDWTNLIEEMNEFGHGRVSYVMTLVGTAVSWQVYIIGLAGLVFLVSSLFANCVSTFGLPIIPVLGVMLYNDKMNGVKVTALLLAIWGFASYIYQEYLDDKESSGSGSNVGDV